MFTKRVTVEVLLNIHLKTQAGTQGTKIIHLLETYICIEKENKSLADNLNAF